MKLIARIIWWLSETLHIPLGKYAPRVFGTMIGSKPVEVDDLGNSFPRRSVNDPMAKYGEILRKCADVADERQQQYGDVTNNFEDIVRICEAAFGFTMTVQDVAKIMIAVKLSRQLHQPKMDNLIDAVNYTAILAFLSTNTDE